MAHPLVILAADSIQAYLLERQIMAAPDDVFVQVPEASRPAAAFVCLKLDGQLRGCVGTVQPVWESLALEIIHNAVGAATRDHRFAPVQAWEAPLLQVTVDVLGDLEAVDRSDDLDPERFGVVVKASGRQGVLLPAIEGITTPAEQIAAAKEKAEINHGEPIELFRFTVTRYR